MSYDNTNTGILSKNDRREKDTHPEYTGTINVDGVDYWLSAWIKEGKPGGKMEGRKFFSLSLRKKEVHREASPSPRKSHGGPQEPGNGYFDDPLDTQF